MPASSSSAAAGATFAADRQAFRERCLRELPGVAPDASLVAVCTPMPSDYWQAAPLELHVFDSARDREVDKIRVASPEALARAREQLVSHRWQRLQPYERRPDETAPQHHCGLEGGRHSDIAEGQGIAVQYHQPTLIVKVPGQRVLVKQDFPQWVQKPQWKLCQYDRLPTVLSGVWASRELGVFLLRIESIRCNERCGHTHYHAVRFGLGRR